MSELSSNPRARASALYRMKSINPLEVNEACPHLPPGEHIDSHKDELYGMLAVLCNKSLSDTLELRERRAPFGLLAPGNRRMTSIASKRHLNVCLDATLEFDASNVREEYAEMTSECDMHLTHLHSMADKSMHPSVRLILEGGISTATKAMDMTYSTLTSGSFGLDQDDLKASWKAVFDQTMLGFKELMVLPVPSTIQETREAVFELDDFNKARLCVNGLRTTDSLQNIADRTTIGCPISFEPGLVRELWNWYVDLRGKVEYS